MMLAVLIVLPLASGAAIWMLLDDGPGARRRCAAAAAASLGATLAVAVAGAATGPSMTWTWGAGLQLSLELPPIAAAVAVTVPAIALAVVVYAAAHEPTRGLTRLVGSLVAFTGAMQLVVVAADLLSLLIGWELVAAFSWALIGHDWRDPSRPARAAHAFNVTRAGTLGLFLAAAATFAATGGLAYTDLDALDGPALHVAAAGVLVAAAAKSGQVPFAPWLFSAMAGPTPVSALLHSATMVAAGAYLLIRLEPALAPAGWFSPATLAIGLATALLGGMVAVAQRRAKHLLAASTSAQYGLMLVAVGAGYPVVAAVHLVAHAVFKSLLFLTAGVAISAVDSERLDRMRLWSSLRMTAILAAVGSLALAAIPPLGAAWSKEQIVGAATHTHVLLGLATMAAGGLSAMYITRFQLLAFGRHDAEQHPDPRSLSHPPGRLEHGALIGLAAASLLLGALWLPPAHGLLRRAGTLPPTATWELVLSLAVVAVAVAAAAHGLRSGWLPRLTSSPAARVVGEWVGLSAASRRLVVDPVLALAGRVSTFDDRVIDAGVRGIARIGAGASSVAGRADDHVVDAGVHAAAGSVVRASGWLARGDVRFVDAGVRGVAAATTVIADRWSRLTELGMDGAVRGVAQGFSFGGHQLRRLQTGAAHHYLTIVIAGAALSMIVAAIWR